MHKKLLGFFSLVLLLVSHCYCQSQFKKLHSRNDNINANKLQIKSILEPTNFGVCSFFLFIPFLMQFLPIAQFKPNQSNHHPTTTIANPKEECLVYLPFDKSAIEDEIGKSISITTTGGTTLVSLPDAFVGQNSLRLASGASLNIELDTSALPMWTRATFCFAVK